MCFPAHSEPCKHIPSNTGTSREEAGRGSVSGIAGCFMVSQTRCQSTGSGPGVALVAKSGTPPACARNPEGWVRASSVRRKKTAI